MSYSDINTHPFKKNKNGQDFFCAYREPKNNKKDDPKARPLSTKTVLHFTQKDEFFMFRFIVELVLGLVLQVLITAIA